MLKKRAANYFKRRDLQDPEAPKRRAYYQTLLRIPEEILKLRKQMNVSQTQLAKQLHTSQSTIALWETPGYEGYTLVKLMALAAELDHNVQIVFTRKHITPTTTQFEDFGKSVDSVLQARSQTDTATKAHNHVTGALV